MKGKNVLVTGGAGYVGSILVGILLHRGYNVRAVDNLMYDQKSLRSYMDINSFEFMLGDLNKEETLDSCLRGIDLVIHLAAIVGDPACSRNPEFSMKINYEVTRRLIDRAKESGIKRFVFSSTCSNYGVKIDEEVCTEETSLNPVSVYAVSKVKSEEYLLQEASRGFDCVILRFATVFGVSHRMRFDLIVNDFTKEAITKREVHVYGEQFWRPYLHVTDISRAICHVLEADANNVSGEVFNVGSNKMNYQKKEIADLVWQEIPEARFTFIKRDHDLRSYRVDFSKIQRVLGFEPVKSIREGVREIRTLLDSGIITNPENRIYYN